MCTCTLAILMPLRVYECARFQQFAHEIFTAAHMQHPLMYIVYMYAITLFLVM